MGRPLKKKFFGSPEQGGMQMVLSYVWMDDSSEPEQGFYIVRQVGTGRYQVTDGSRVGVVRLVGETPSAPGEGAILVYPFEGEPEYAKKIHNRTVVTHSGNTYKWSVESATETGQADFILDTWEEPEGETLFFIFSQAFEGGIGYYDNVGGIEGQPEGLTIIGLFDSDVGRLYLSGDHPEIASIAITIGDMTNVFEYSGNEGNTEFLSDDFFGFQDNTGYGVTGFEVTMFPE